MNDVIAARALHVLAVVIWIGGVSMATTVALPAIRRGDLGQNRLLAFQAIERRFVWQARTAVIVVGLTGFYMTWRLDLWERFRTGTFWWMHAMVCVATVRLCPVRRRAVHSAPPLPSVGDRTAGCLFPLATPRALRAAGAERPVTGVWAA
jgi:hypothetical protein